MPSNGQVKKEITSFLLRSLPLHTFKTPFKIYELGSGWGGLLFTMARNCPSALFHAFELSPLPWFVSFVVHKIAGYSNVHIKRKNFFLSPLESADIVVCYLYPGAMQKLKIKFEKELKVGTLVISNSFVVPGWVPEKVICLEGIWKTEIFIYQVQ